MRQYTLPVGGVTVPLPCFFPSVSSVKANLRPADYVELLDAAGHPLFLLSAYDIAISTPDQRLRIDGALTRSKTRGSIILMDSGNYEGFWKGEPSWTSDRFHNIAKTTAHHLCFCHDNQNPPASAAAIADDVVSSVLRDQPYASGTVVPIVHGPAHLLPDAAAMVAKQLFPVMIAVPERALGEGILARARTVRQIRRALDSLGVYCPLHLLGTGNPLSMATYAMAGGDSFDGLEWCQTVVDHVTGQLFHFQHWDLFREQTQWGTSGGLPFIQSALMHNLTFYRMFTARLREALSQGSGESMLQEYAPQRQASALLAAITGGD